MFTGGVGSEGIRVVVAENTRMASRLLADALSQDGALGTVIAASSVAESLQAIAEIRPAVVVVSDALDDEPKRGFQLAREIRAAWPEIRVVMLLDGCRPDPVVEAFRAGARGVFSRNESLKELATCISRVSRGEIWARSEHMAFAIEALASAPVSTEVNSEALLVLSRREREVVDALADGLSNREIGERMNLSRHTVKNYVCRIFEKLGVSTRFELMVALSRRQNPAQRGLSTEGGADPAELMASLVAAAEAGVASAQFVVGHMYLYGEGVRRDKVLAYKWLLLAEQANQAFSEASRRARKKLATELLSAQVSEAEHLVSQWVGTSENVPWSRDVSNVASAKAATSVA
jgi:two-component system, NarL family, nitrate/nitrite response regulator NarL